MLFNSQHVCTHVHALRLLITLLSCGVASLNRYRAAVHEIVQSSSWKVTQEQALLIHT